MISEWVKEQIRVSYKYYYTILSESEKIIYNQLLGAISEYKANCEIVESIGICDFSKIFNYLLLDNPSVFYVDTVTMFRIGKRLIARISYVYSRDVATNIAKKVDLRLKKIVRACSADSLLNTEKNVHDYLIQHVQYDDRRKDEAHSVHAALLHGEAVCDGFSKAAKLIFDQVSIQSIIVVGVGDSHLQSMPNHAEGHSWNIVDVYGHLYHLDVTFDANLSDNNHIRYDYFNLNDEQIKRDHILDTFSQINASQDVQDYYSLHGLYFKSKRQLRNALLTVLKKQESHFTFRLPFTKDPQKTLDEICDLVKSTVHTASQRCFRHYYISTNPQQMIIHLHFSA